MKRTVALGLLAAGLLFVTVGCETATEPALNQPSAATPSPAPGADTFKDRQERLAGYRAEFDGDVRKLYTAATLVDVSDGIQEREAWILANSYLQAWVDKSALIIEMKQSPLHWIAENMSAATNGPGPTIQVNKDNGSIQRKGSLQLVWPESFRDKL